MTITSEFDDFLDACDEDTGAPVVPFKVAADNQTHKLQFLCARAKNFRSIGNAFIEIDFTKAGSNLTVSDENGSGKSTMTVWCPYYCITGKPYSDKEKVTSLVNTANKRDMLCELEFLKGGNHYKIRRGRKGEIEFDIQIMDNGVWKTIDADAAKADWQGYLWALLGLDAKTGPRIIENVVILGKSKFKPFIEMGAEDRRKMVEPIWDLGIFTELNEELKADRKKTSDELDDAHSNVDSKFNTVTRYQADKTNQNTKIEGLAQTHSERAKSCADAIEFKTIAKSKLELKLDCVRSNPDALAFKEQVEGTLVQLREGLDEVKAGRQKSIDEAVSSSGVAGVAINQEISSEENAHVENNKRIRKILPDAEAVLEVYRKTETVNLDVMALAHDNAGIAEKNAHNDWLDKVSILTEVQKVSTDTLMTKISKMQGFKAQFDAAIEMKKKVITDIGSLDDCPTCQQSVGTAHKQYITDGVNKEISELDGKIVQAANKINEFQGELDVLKRDLETAQKDESEAKTNYANLKMETASAKMDFDNAQRQMLAEVNKVNDAMVRMDNESDAEMVRHNKAIETLKARLLSVDSDAATIGDKRAAEIDAKIKLFEERIADHETMVEDKVQENIAAIIKEIEQAESERIDAFNKDAEMEAANEAEMEAECLKMKDIEANLEVAVTELDDANEVVNDLQKDLEDWDALKLLLSDKEGKADIIRKYIPFLNSKINEYLEGMNMFIGFEMDEAFNTQMTAPDRSNQSLFSLSDGQRARVNLAIVFALRDVANLKASISTNLLILDEVLENLSERGALEATTMIKTKFSGSNLHVITQRAGEFSEHFDDITRYGLRGGYTEII